MWIELLLRKKLRVPQDKIGNLLMWIGSIWNQYKLWNFKPSICRL